MNLVKDFDEKFTRLRSIIHQKDATLNELQSRVEEQAESLVSRDRQVQMLESQLGLM